MYKYLIFLMAFSFSGFAQNPLYSKLESQMDYALREASIYAIPKGEKIFPRTVRNDSLILVGSKDWCSGFLVENYGTSTN